MAGLKASLASRPPSHGQTSCLCRESQGDHPSNVGKILIGVEKLFLSSLSFFPPYGRMSHPTPPSFVSAKKTFILSRQIRKLKASSLNGTEISSSKLQNESSQNDFLKNLGKRMKNRVGEMT